MVSQNAIIGPRAARYSAGDTPRVAGIFAPTRAGGPRSGGGRQGAQALVEFALVLSMLSLLLAGTIDFGRVFYYDVVISAAALEGALAAAAGSPDAGVLTVTRESAPVGVGPALSIAVTPAAAQRQAGASPVWTTVAVSYTFEPLTPLVRVLLGPSYTFTRRVSQQLRTSCALTNGTPC